MKKKELSITQLVEVTGKNKPYLYRQVRDGLLYREESGLFTLSHPTNRKWLKDECGLYLKDIIVPEPGKAGRPVNPHKTVKGKPQAVTPAGNEELRKIRAVQRLLVMSEKIKFERSKVLNVDSVKYFCEVYLSTWEGVNAEIVPEACKLYYDAYAIKRPPKKIRDKLKNAIFKELAGIQSSRESTIDKFLKSLEVKKIETPEDKKISEMKQHAKNTPAELQKMISQNLTFDVLSKLSKFEIDRLKLLLEIQYLEQKINVQKGIFISVEKFKLLKQRLDDIEQNYFLNLYRRMDAHVKKIFKCTDDMKIFNTGNAAQEFFYTPLNAARRGIREKLSNNGI